MKLSEAVTVLTQIQLQMTKAKDEIIAKLSDLQAALDQIDVPPDEAIAALQAVKDAAQQLDDIIPD